MSQGPPAVSVVIPAFNAAATIESTLRSVLAQTFTDFEVLVIDDGSTDDTVRIARAAGDPRIAVHSFENRGLPASRNRGIARARGDWVAFLDADDLWHPAKLERQRASSAAWPGAALVYCWSDCIDEQDGFLVAGSHILADGSVYEQLLRGNFLDNGSTALVRRSVFGVAGPFDESLTAAEDWDCWLRIALHHDVVCVPEVLTLYRVHGQAMSSNIRRQAAECLRVLDTGVDRLAASPDREALRRAGRADIYRYLVGRLLWGSGGLAAGLLAGRFVLAYVRQAGLTVATLRYALAQFLRIGIVVLLPATWSRSLFRRVAALRNRSVAR